MCIFSFVRLALSVLEKFGMITRDGNLLTIPGWEEHQNIEGMDKIREQNRIRKQKQRERQRNMIEQDMSRDSSRDVTQQNKIKNKKEELDKDKESNYCISRLNYDERITNRILERSLEIPFPEESVREHIAETMKQQMIAGIMGGGK